MSTVIMQQHQSPFFDFGDFILKNQNSSSATPPQRNNTSSNSNNNMTSSVIGQHQQQQKMVAINGLGKGNSHFHLQNPSQHHFLAHQNMLNNNVNNNHSSNGFLNDKNNNLVDNLDSLAILGHPPSSPTNSQSSSMSTSSSASSSTSNSNTILIDQQNLKHLIAQQIQQHHNHNQKLLMHNALQRTVSHPHHSQMNFVSSIMDNLTSVGLAAVNSAVSNSAVVATSPILVSSAAAAAAGGCGDVISATHRKLERTQSEPLPQQQVNTSRYKTELCRPFEEAGECKYGDKCQFAHGIAELRNLQRHPRYKTELCRTFHSVGYCPYGPRCHFVHNADEVRPNQPPNSPPGQQQQPSSGTQQSAQSQNQTQQQPQQQQQQQQQHNLINRTTSLQNGPLIGNNAGNNVNQFGGMLANLASPPLSMSTGSDRASPTGSLSLSPTNSMVSFFPETSPFQTNSGNGTTSFPYSSNISTIIPSPPPSPRDLSPTPMNHISPSSLSSSSSTSSVVSSTSCNSSGNSSGSKLEVGDARLPVFNRLSSTLESTFNALEL